MLQAFKSTDIETRGKVEPITAQYCGYLRQGLDVNALVGSYTVKTAQTVEAGSISTRIVCTGIGSSLYRGDYLVFTSGSYSGLLTFISYVSTDYLDLAQALPASPGVGDTFSVYRLNYLSTTSSGSLSVSMPNGNRVALYPITNATATVQAGSTASHILLSDVFTSVFIGDIIRFDTGSLKGGYGVVSATYTGLPTKYVDIAIPMPSAPAAGVVVQFCRTGFIAVGATGVVAVSIGANTEIVPLPMIETPAANILGGYLAPVISYEGLRYIEIDNGTNADIWVSIDAGATDYWVVRSLSTKPTNFGSMAVNGYYPETMSVCYKRKTGVPTTGSVLLTAYQ